MYWLKENWFKIILSILIFVFGTIYFYQENSLKKLEPIQNFNESERIIKLEKELEILKNKPLKQKAIEKKIESKSEPLTPVLKILTNEQIVKKIKPSVVLIRTSDACGTGMIISSDGYILTNEHVIRNSTFVSVYFTDFSSVPAQVAVSDPDLDLALLKVDLSDLPFVTLGDPTEDNLPLGSEVLALGFPLTCNEDITLVAESGSVTAWRHVKSLGKYLIQTSARINHGNSGGPLVNKTGEVIGVNTYSEGPTGSIYNITGIGYSIPTSYFVKSFLGRERFAVLTGIATPLPPLNGLNSTVIGLTNGRLRNQIDDVSLITWIPEQNNNLTIDNITLTLKGSAIMNNEPIEVYMIDANTNAVWGSSLQQICQLNQSGSCKVTFNPSYFVVVPKVVKIRVNSTNFLNTPNLDNFSITIESSNDIIWSNSKNYGMQWNAKQFPIKIADVNYE